MLRLLFKNDVEVLRMNISEFDAIHRTPKGNFLNRIDQLIDFTCHSPQSKLKALQIESCILQSLC